MLDWEMGGILGRGYEKITAVSATIKITGDVGHHWSHHDDIVDYEGWCENGQEDWSCVADSHHCTQNSFNIIQPKTKQNKKNC